MYVRTYFSFSNLHGMLAKQDNPYNIMKIISPFTLFVAMSLTTIIVSDDTRAALELAKPSPAFFSNSLKPMKFRNLAMLDKCALETDALYNTSTLNASYTTWETELLHQHASLGDNVCVAVASDNHHFACTLDSSKIATASHVPLLDSCQQVGGTAFFESQFIGCLVTDYDGKKFQFDISILQVPHCLAASSCINVAQHKLGFSERAVEKYEQSLSSLFQAASCTSAAFRWSAWFGVAVTSTTALLFLFE